MDVVDDPARNIVYISTSDGNVLRYSLASQSFLTPFALGGSLCGMDISPDDNTLVVADTSSGATTNHIDVVNLTTGSSQQIPFALASGESGTYTAAFANNNTVLVTSDYNGSGKVPLREVDLTTETCSILQTVDQATMLSPSADHSVVAYAEANDSNGPVGRFRVADGSLAGTDANWSTFEIGVNRNGTQYAVPTYDGTFIYDQNFNYLATIGAYASAAPIGVAYSPVSDVVYFAWYDWKGQHAAIDAYDTDTLTWIQNIDTGAPFGWVSNSAFVDGRLKDLR